MSSLGLLPTPEIRALAVSSLPGSPRSGTAPELLRRRFLFCVAEGGCVRYSALSDKSGWNRGL